MAEKKGTPVVCGGVYESKELIYGKKVRAMVVSTTDEGKPGALGLLMIRGYAAESVQEGGERINQFKLVAKPAELKSPGRPRKTTTTK